MEKSEENMKKNNNRNHTKRKEITETDVNGGALNFLITLYPFGVKPLFQHVKMFVCFFLLFLPVMFAVRADCLILWFVRIFAELIATQRGHVEHNFEQTNVVRPHVFFFFFVNSAPIYYIKIRTVYGRLAIFA